jgi:hypothetical protein
MAQRHDSKFVIRAVALQRFVVQALACLAFLTPGGRISTRAADYTIQWRTNSVEATGFGSTPPETNFSKLFSIQTDQSNGTSNLNLPAIAGSYKLENGTLTFTPQFPFQPGVNYRAVLHIRDKIISSTHLIPAPKFEATAFVSAIYPAVDSLPENLLKFYLFFSAPMSGGHIYDHIRLRDADGKEVQLPFLEIDEELWDPAMTRLTLFLDPGRIKRGVRPLEEIGPALRAGKTYTLRISRDWRDANGASLKSDFEKSFKVTEADREPPNPHRWKITAPKSKSRDPLTIGFDEPLDHALVRRVLRIADSSGAEVLGTVTLDDADRTWRFVPKNRWAAGIHKLIVPTIIEDLAGNNIGKPFDLDLEENPRPPTNEVVRVSFTIH